MQNTYPVSNKKFEKHVNDTTKHITATERSNWNNKANGTHTHTTSQVSGLDTALAGKSSTSHTHTASSVGAIGFPDYARAATIFRSGSGISSTNQYTISSNGYLLINVSDPGNAEEWQNIVLYINNQPITIGNKFGESAIYKTSNTSILLPIAGGSSLYITAKNVTGLTYDVVFIPMK